MRSLTISGVFHFLGLAISLLTAAAVIWMFLPSFVVATFLYYCLRPVHGKVTRYTDKERLSVLGTVVGALAPTFALLGYLVYVGIREVRQLLERYNLDINDFASDLYFELFFLTAENPIQIIQSEQGIARIRELIEYSLFIGTILGDFFLQLIIMAIILYHLLLHDTELKNWCLETTGVTTIDTYRFWQKIDRDLQSVYLGNILNGIITAVIGFFVFYIYSSMAPEAVSISFPLALGMLAGIASLVPVIGVKLVYVPVTMYFIAFSYYTGNIEVWPHILVFVLVSGILVDFIPDLFIRPYVSSKNVLMTILLIAYIAGAIVLGWYGFFLAPVLFVFSYHFLVDVAPKTIDRYIERSGPFFSE